MARLPGHTSTRTATAAGWCKASYRCRIAVARAWTTITIIVIETIITAVVFAITCIKSGDVSTQTSAAVITVIITNAVINIASK